MCMEKLINGRYFISREGQVFDTKRNCYSAVSKHNRGYLLVSIKEDGKWKNKYIHRLVAKIYDPNFQEHLTVNHIDGNKENNHIDNLESLTERENQYHAFKTGLKKGSMDKIEKKCSICNKDFSISPCRFKRAVNHYCSRVCSDKAQFTGRYIPCLECGKLKYKDKLSLSRTKKTFCSQFCVTEWRKKTLKENW